MLASLALRLAMKRIIKVLLPTTLLTLCVLLYYAQTLFHTSLSPLNEPIHDFVADSKVGVVLNLLIWEQMGNAASNLINSQCWAESMHMRVVEPSIRESENGGDQVFYFSEDFQNTERFRDLFDIGRWNEYSKQHGYASLISVEEFLESGSRNIIYVQVQYSTAVCWSPTHTPQPLLFLHSRGFKTVKKICLNLLHEGRLRTKQELTDLIFGDSAGLGSYTVVFNEWRGIRSESESEGKLSNVKPGPSYYRILVKDSHCTYSCINHEPYHKTWLPAKRLNTSLSAEYDPAVLKNSEMGFIPSDRVLADSARYKTQYLNNRPYIAVMMRMENLQHGIAGEDSYASCLGKATKLWNYASDKYGINQTFITSDLSKYGSYSWSRSNQQLSARFQKDIVKMAGMPPLSGESINNNLETLTHSTGRVRLSWTQSIIAAEARCVIFLGGGSFQGLILNLHSALYLGRECFVYLNTQCKQLAKLGFE